MWQFSAGFGAGLDMLTLTATDASTGRGLGCSSLHLYHCRLLCDMCFFIAGDLGGGLSALCLPSFLDEFVWSRACVTLVERELSYQCSSPKFG